jgi:hypothetical protein
MGSSFSPLVAPALLGLALFSPAIPVASAQVATAADGPDGPATLELFPWQDPLSGWEPFHMGFLLRGWWLDDEGTALGGGGDPAGFFLEDARVAVSGELDDGLDYRFSFDAGDEGSRPSGEIELLEGWASVALGERESVTLGRFRRPFLRSSIVDQGTLLFIDRTASGDRNNVYDLGARFDARYELVDLTVAAQNGDSGQASELRTTVRAELQLLGGGVALEDAPYRSTPGQQLSVGLAFADEAAVFDGDSFAFDAAWRWGTFGLSGEWVDAGAGAYDDPSLSGATDSFAVTASWLPLPEEWAVGLRYQSFDDIAGTEVWSAAAKRYLIRGRIAGHLQLDRVSADDPNAEGWRMAVGTTLAF